METSWEWEDECYVYRIEKGEWVKFDETKTGKVHHVYLRDYPKSAPSILLVETRDSLGNQIYGGCTWVSPDRIDGWEAVYNTK